MNTHTPQSCHSRKLFPDPMHLFQLAIQHIRVIDQFFEALNISIRTASPL